MWSMVAYCLTVICLPPEPRGASRRVCTASSTSGHLIPSIVSMTLRHMLPPVPAKRQRMKTCLSCNLLTALPPYISLRIIFIGSTGVERPGPGEIKRGG